ncbi:response regulator [Zunongwangia sp. SCSIO 43204]|uniref:Response regulator receiver domain-containing protein n=1 Tax=Zunongwangia mangrovi TaxID=1334022 RepID=A0A1I1J9R0_9FLAO|nr:MULTISPECIES: response regulator [Zunongwangia]UAB82733.1 response regulator [Zunongwangia sp. SCSIO 43204]SFC42673.1 Response regulator receiver domain-containing protein [Zunongwangia mangrovi]
MTPIILVDDQPIANFITKKLLEIEGYKENVKDYTDALSAFENIKAEASAIIFLDLNMPVMSGWDFLEEMKKFGLSHKTIILSSSTSELDIEKAKQYPCVIDYVVKPLNKMKFNKISSYLKAG